MRTVPFGAGAHEVREARRTTRPVLLAVGLFLALGLVPWTGPMPAEATGHSASMEDPAGDTFFFGGPGAPVGVPDTQFSKEVDIVRIFIENESATDVTIGLQVAGFDASRDTAPFEVQTPDYAMRFEVSSDPDATWDARTFGCFLCTRDADGDRLSFWELCRAEDDGEDFNRDCWYVGWPTQVDKAEGTLKFPLDRQILAQLAEVEPAEAGDTITILSASADGSAFMSDRAPDDGDGPTLTFESGTANQRLALDFQDEGNDEEGERDPSENFGYGYVWKPWDAFGVSPGGQLVLPLTVENRMESKKIVALSVELEAEDASAWNLSYPAQLVVPGGDKVVASLVLGVEEGVAHRAWSRLAITARAVGEPDVLGLVHAFVQATVTPSPADNVLYFHSERGHFFSFGGLEEPVYGANPDLFSYSWGALNVLDQDPTYLDHEVPVIGPDSGRTWFYAALDTPLAQDLRFDLRGNVTMDLVMISRQVSPTVRIEANLFHGETHIGGTGQTVSVTPNAQTVTLQFAPRLERETLGALEGGLYAVLMFDEVGPGAAFGNFFGTTPLVPTVYFRAADSKITLPLLPLGKSEAHVAGGQYLVSLDLKEGKDPEEYVNPGRGLLFNMSLGNQGTTNDTVLLSLNRSAGDGWLVTIAQSKKVRLGPGEFANTTVVVRAPAGAEEGDRVSFDVVATSLGDPEAKATMRLTVIATKGVDIDDETFGPSLGVKSGQAKKKDSPLGGEVVLAAGALAVLVARRRRRGDD